MTLATYIQNVLIGFVALFPVMNPIGNAFALNPYFSGVSRIERRKMAFRIALYSFYICLITLFSGSWILKLFGLSVPVIRLAGGILICKIGWDFLFNDGGGVHHDRAAGGEEAILSQKLFYPISFPMTAGAGTISVLFMLGSQSSMVGLGGYLLDTSAIIISIIGVCLIVFFAYSNANSLIKRMGKSNEMMINRIMAFLIFAVGLQIGYTALVSLIT